MQIAYRCGERWRMAKPADIEQHSVTTTPDWLTASLSRMRIVGAYTLTASAPLPGGVSSDIFRLELSGSTICVKRALPKLKVAADWRVPPERNRNEVEWIKVAGSIVPGAVPAIIAEDADGGAFAMSYLPPETYPNWKERLRDGDIEIAFAAAVGD